MTFTLGLGLLFAANEASAWGEDGHKVVGEIAWNLLENDSKAALMPLFTPDYPSLAEMSVWADRVRSNAAFGPAGSWHYVNAPESGTPLDVSTACPPERGCVVTAIEAQAAILADGSEPLWKRRQALMWLIHFVGDVHQPLHAGHKEDRGGNLLDVSYEGRTQNLHRVWDTSLIEAHEDQWQDLAEVLLNGLTPEARSAWRVSVDPLEWALESQALAEQYAYAVPKKGKLTRAYESQAWTVVQSQLQGAGVRLAALIDRALVKDLPALSQSQMPSKIVPLHETAWIPAGQPHTAQVAPPLAPNQRSLRVVSLIPHEGSGAGRLGEVEDLKSLQPSIVILHDGRIGDGSWGEMYDWMETNFGSQFKGFRDYAGPDDHPTGVLSSLPVIEAGPLRDPTTSDTNFSWARISTPDSKDLWVFSADFSQKRKERKEQAERLLKGIRDRVPVGGRVILGGDLAFAQPAEPALRILRSYFDQSGLQPNLGLLASPSLLSLRTSASGVSGSADSDTGSWVYVRSLGRAVFLQEWALP